METLYDVPRPLRVRHQLYSHLIGAIRMRKMRWPGEGEALPPGAMRQRLSRVFPSEFWQSTDGSRPDYAVFPWNSRSEGWKASQTYTADYGRIRTALLGCAASVRVQSEKEVFLAQARRMFAENAEGILVGARVTSTIANERSLRRPWIVRPCYAIRNAPEDRGASHTFYFLGEKDRCPPLESTLEGRKLWASRWEGVDCLLEERAERLQGWLSEQPWWKDAPLPVRLFEAEDAVRMRQYWLTAPGEK